MNTQNTTETMKTISNGNSIINQKIKEKFVNIHVQANVTMMVEYIINKDDKNAPFTRDDIENNYSYPEYKGIYADFDGGTEEQKKAEIDRLNELWDGTTDLQDYPNEIMAEIETLEDLDSEYPEIYEWWIVSNFLYRKLKEYGQPVVDGNIWGRTCSGQAILLDYVITQICADMEILEGQKNQWSVN